MGIKRVAEVILGTVVFAGGLIGIAIGLAVSMTIILIIPGLVIIAGGAGMCSVGVWLCTGRKTDLRYKNIFK